MMTDFLTVKAKRTFAVGVGLKTRHSPEFEVEAGEARLLAAQGLVEIVGVVGAGAVDATAMESDDSDSETDGAKSTRKSRKG